MKSMKTCTMYNKCRVCSTSIAPPPRARVSGIRATNFGDVIFVDHAEIQLRKGKYVVLLVLDGASNLLWATSQTSLSNKETIQALRLWTDENHCMPKAIVGDEAFFQENCLTYYRAQGIKECPCGSRTPWPNRAESAVRLFKRQWQIMSKNLEDDRFRGVTVREAVKRTFWARNTQLTVSGYSPLEIATGRRPPDLLDIETSDPAQLSVDPLPEDKTQQELQRLALKARREARQAAERTMPFDGPYKPGDKVFVWTSPVNANLIASKAWKKERWVRGTVISQKVLWSMFMLAVQLCVSINQRSDVIMMNGMMLLFLGLMTQILSHLQLKMKMITNQAELNMLRLTSVSRLTGSVKGASVMWLSSLALAATLVLVGTCQD